MQSMRYISCLNYSFQPICSIAELYACLDCLLVQNRATTHDTLSCTAAAKSSGTSFFKCIDHCACSEIDFVVKICPVYEIVKQLLSKNTSATSYGQDALG